MDDSRSDELYRVLFDHVDNMVCTLDLEGRFTSVNAAGERLTGFAARELHGRFAVELIAPEYRDEAVSRFRHRLETKEELPPDESWLIKRDGSRVPIEITSALVFDGEEPAGVLGLVRELSERHGAEEALLRSEERYRNAFASAAIGMALIAPDGRFIQVNDSFCELVGRPAEELCTLTWRDVTHPDDLGVDVGLMRQLIAGEIRSYHAEKRYRHQGGADVWALITVSLVRDAEGEPLHFVSQIQDVTERKQAEEQLAQSRLQLAHAQRLAQIGNWKWHVATDAVTWSDELYRIFGLDPGLDLPSTEALRDFVHPDDRARVRELSDRVRETGESYTHQYRVVLADGTTRWVEGRGVASIGEDGLSMHGTIQDITDRKQAEHALATSQARLAKAQRIGQIGDWKRDGPDQPLTWSDETYRIFGLDPESGPPTYDRLLAVIHPDEREEFERIVKACRVDGKPYSHEYRVVLADGSVRWIHGRGELVPGAGDGPATTRGTAQDITERKDVEQRLAEAQRIAQIGNWAWREDPQTLTWSEELYRILDFDPGDEPSLEKLTQRVHPDDREAFERVVAEARERNEDYLHQYRIVLRDGSIRWIEGRGVAIAGVTGYSMHGTAQDITEDKAAGERLAEAEERYRTLVEQLPLGTYIRPLDMTKPNIYASPQVEPMLGYPAEAWMTDPGLLASIVHPDDRDRVLSEAVHVRGTGEPLRNAEYRYLKPDGSVVWVQDETYVVEDDAGEPRCVQGYLLDITERKLAEEENDRLREQLHHAQKLEAVGRLAGGVAHDFNNMLTAIKGYAELLLGGLELGNPQRAEAEQIHRAASQASALPRQLLAFSRKQVLEPRLVDLNDVVAEATDLIRLLVGGGVEVVTHAEARPAAVVADPGQVEQVLVNLATNARDAMPEGGTLTISTRNVDVDPQEARKRETSPGRYVVASVSDTGHGMDAETLDQVFEPFFTTKAVGQGSGLGLASSYGISRQSGGFMAASSEPDHGTTFDVYFPLAVAEAAPVEGAQVQAPSRAPEPAAVLLVEDEEIVREFARTALERAGYRVLAASRASEALELLATGVDLDVLVSDVVMPGMGGRELAERVLADRPGTGIVLVSGYSEEPAAGDLAGGQMPVFLQKPFSVPALVDAVRDVVEARSGRRPAPTIQQLGISCLVADDHPAVLDSVSRFLESSGVDVVARAARGDEALAALETHRPDVALLDVSMEPMNGIEVARRAARLTPATQVILYTGYRDTSLLEQALDAGARGFVLKEAPLSELMRAMKVVAGGGTFVDLGLSDALATPGTVRSLPPLTAREQQVLALVADGMTNERVAEELGISAETVQSHVRNAMSKLEADTRTQAVATALRQSLIA
ncbi:MAG TPA: PAS domain S-box protein [Gaiellaceae bacterium]|nr:PAS domain S-box protein [Gaiellaceae bacterium]